jgi:hypothetical protein
VGSDFGRIGSDPRAHQHSCRVSLDRRAHDAGRTAQRGPCPCRSDKSGSGTRTNPAKAGANPAEAGSHEGVTAAPHRTTSSDGTWDPRNPAEAAASPAKAGANPAEAGSHESMTAAPHRTTSSDGMWDPRNPVEAGANPAEAGSHEGVTAAPHGTTSSDGTWDPTSDRLARIHARISIRVGCHWTGARTTPGGRRSAARALVDRTNPALAHAQIRLKPQQIRLKPDPTKAWPPRRTERRAVTVRGIREIRLKPQQIRLKPDPTKA